MTDTYLQPAEFAAWLSENGCPVSVRTLARWRSAGVGPAYIKVGKRVLYRKSAGEAYLRAHEVVPPREKHRLQEVV